MNTASVFFLCVFFLYFFALVYVCRPLICKPNSFLEMFVYFISISDRIPYWRGILGARVFQTLRKVNAFGGLSWRTSGQTDRISIAGQTDKADRRTIGIELDFILKKYNNQWQFKILKIIAGQTDKADRRTVGMELAFSLKKCKNQWQSFKIFKILYQERCTFLGSQLPDRRTERTSGQTDKMVQLPDIQFSEMQTPTRSPQFINRHSSGSPSSRRVYFQARLKYYYAPHLRKKKKRKTYLSALANHQTTAPDTHQCVRLMENNSRKPWV